MGISRNSVMSNLLSNWHSYRLQMLHHLTDKDLDHSRRGYKAWGTARRFSLCVVPVQQPLDSFVATRYRDTRRCSVIVCRPVSNKLLDSCRGSHRNHRAFVIVRHVSNKLLDSCRGYKVQGHRRSSVIVCRPDVQNC
ncbi:hypothetical protein AVEN_60817-1 [Araneus ventricosus]|uniref:Uncharacterized protein n=1 Tax=Araneus ventricosus TaxID=182803 RepID=A0A4Y2H9K3_ARAVE|nr:hypothetical protein AVEN_60817-1 [Araneus ventricosus]